MAKILPFEIKSDIKVELIKACQDDKELRSVVTKMSDDQAKAAFSSAQDNLLALVDGMIKADKDFAQFIKKRSEENDNLLILIAAINYIAEFCAQVPKQADYVNELDNAYQSIFNTEVLRAVAEAVTKNA